MWVAACCLTHGIPLATLNLKDYEDFNQHHGLRILGREQPEFSVAGRFQDWASSRRGQAHHQEIPRSMSRHSLRLASWISSNFDSSHNTWGGWGSNPRPADYENYGPALPTLYLHGYHGAVLPMAFIALYARMARSTNRSTITTASA